MTCHIGYIEKAFPWYVLLWYGFVDHNFLNITCHTGCTDMASQQCVVICNLRLLLLVKNLSHWVHWYSFSPVCVFMWVWRWILDEYDLSHLVHGNGLSPLCVVDMVFPLCVFSYDFPYYYILRMLYCIGCIYGHIAEQQLWKGFLNFFAWRYSFF